MIYVIRITRLNGTTITHYTTNIRTVEDYLNDLLSWKSISVEVR